MRRAPLRRYMIDILSEDELDIIRDSLRRSRHLLFFEHSRAKIDELLVRLQNAKEVK